MLSDEKEAAAAFPRTVTCRRLAFSSRIRSTLERTLRRLHDRALASALERAKALGVSGKEVTPVLLAEFARYTAGASVEVNRELVVANAGLAGRISAEIARHGVSFATSWWSAT